MATWVSVVAPAMIAIGCGGAPTAAATSPAGASSSSPAGDAGTPPSGVTDAIPASASAAGGGAASAAPAGAANDSATAAPPPPAHPFAKNAVEATSLIDDALNSRANELGQCVDAARARRKSAHAKLVIEIGIDEEGHLLGVQLPKGEKPDKGFVDCVLAGLRGAPFPKSHAGVITLRKTFEDKAVYR